MIRIFNAEDTSFNSNGNIVINPLKIIETKKKSLNGWYIDVDVPIKYKEHIEQDMICVTKSKSKISPQAFRISNPKQNGRKISFTAHHVVFDSRNLFLVDVRPTNMGAIGCLNYVNDKTDSKSPFSFTSNVNSSSTAYFIRKSLFEAFETIEERWGGIFDADNFSITFNKDVSIDKGATLNYGVDLQNVEVIEDWSSVVTTLYPTGKEGLMLPEKYISSTVKYAQPYSKTVQFETQLEEDDQTETQLIDELRYNAMRYMEINQYPRVSYTIKSDIKQDLNIGDLVVVKHPYVEINTQVQEYTYNPVLDRVLSLVFGNYTRDVKKRFDQIKDSIQTAHDKASKVEELTKHQTDLINSLNKNGLVYIDDNEILVLDKLPKSEAKNVWRFGLGGIGFSKNGYEGPFDFAFTQDGKFNASFIAAGSILTNMLSSDVGSSLDLSSNVSLNMIVDDIKKEMPDENLIVGLNGEFDMRGWTFEGDGYLKFGDRTRFFEGMRWNSIFVPIATKSLSGIGLKFVSPGSALSPFARVFPDVKHSYRVKRISGTQRFTVSLLEYNSSNTLIKTTNYEMNKNNAIEEFTQELNSLTTSVRLKFTTYDRTPLVLSDAMFNRGEPKNWSPSVGNVEEYSKSGIKVLSDEMSLFSQITDSLEQSVTEVSVKLSAAEKELILRVAYNDIISAINLSPEEVAILANRIRLEGIVTANEYFKILLDGSAEMKNALVRGTIEAIAGKIAGFDINGTTLKGDGVQLDRNQITVGPAVFSPSTTTSGSSIKIKARVTELGDDTETSNWMIFGGKILCNGWVNKGFNLNIYSITPTASMDSNGENTSRIGSLTERFGYIYLANQPNVSSDIRYKSNIQDIDNDLLDAFEEVMPKLFNTEFDNNLHFGYIAQDVERALYKYCLKKYGYEFANEKVKQFAVLSKSESYLSLLYGELTVIKNAYYHREVERLKYQNQALLSELQAIKQFIGMEVNNA